MPCGPSPRPCSTPARQCSLCPQFNGKAGIKEQENVNQAATGSPIINYYPATCVREFVREEEIYIAKSLKRRWLDSLGSSGRREHPRFSFHQRNTTNGITWKSIGVRCCTAICHRRQSSSEDHFSAGRSYASWYAQFIGWPISQETEPQHRG